MLEWTYLSWVQDWARGAVAVDGWTEVFTYIRGARLKKTGVSYLLDRYVSTARGILDKIQGETDLVVAMGFEEVVAYARQIVEEETSELPARVLRMLTESIGYASFNYSTFVNAVEAAVALGEEAIRFCLEKRTEGSVEQVLTWLTETNDIIENYLGSCLEMPEVIAPGPREFRIKSDEATFDRVLVAGS